jgi:hypothetical protein
VKSLRELAVSRDHSLTDSEQRKTIGHRQPPDVSFDEARPQSPSVEGIGPEQKSGFDRKGYHRQYIVSICAPGGGVRPCAEAALPREPVNLTSSHDRPRAGVFRVVWRGSIRLRPRRRPQPIQTLTRLAEVVFGQAA